MVLLEETKKLKTQLNKVVFFSNKLVGIIVVIVRRKIRHVRIF